MSESASEKLHAIVRDVAEHHFDGRRHMLSLQRRIHGFVDSREATDRAERELTELIGSEATAAYLFGLAVGLAMRALPERLNRHR